MQSTACGHEICVPHVSALLWRPGIALFKAADFVRIGLVGKLLVVVGFGS